MYKIDEYKYIIYILKCFCDAIVFKYIPKWNIRHYLVNQDNFGLKEESGFISGKMGLKNELEIAFGLAQKGFVPLLNDLTNVMRHGDISLLGNEIPFVMEVKSSHNSNRRVDRQLKSLENLQAFYLNDGGDISGFQDIKRVSLDCTEKAYTDFINSTAEKALESDACISEPEAGVRYLAITGDDANMISEAIDGMQEPVACYINAYKNIEGWSDYTPFTLSFQEPDALYAFLSGKIILIVFVDLGILRKKAEAIGINIENSDKEDYAFKLTKKIKPNDDFEYMYVSNRFFGRVFLEFMSTDIIFSNVDTKEFFKSLEV